MGNEKIVDRTTLLNKFLCQIFSDTAVHQDLIGGMVKKVLASNHNEFPGLLGEDEILHMDSNNLSFRLLVYYNRKGRDVNQKTLMSGQSLSKNFT